MKKMTEQITKAQGRTLELMGEAHKRALDVNEKLAERVKGRVPTLKVPFAEMVPTPKESVKLYFDFAGKVLASNRKFAEHLVDAWERPEKVAKPAARRTVKAA